MDSVVLVLVLLGVGCSGGGGTATTVAPTDQPLPTAVVTAEPPSTVTSTVATTTLASTLAPTTTTLPVATTAPPVDTSVPEGVPPRVTFPDDPDLQAVVDAFYAFSEAYTAALADPGNPTSAAIALDLLIDPIRERLETALADLVAAGEAYVLDPEQPQYTEIYELSVNVVDELAFFDACSVDTDLHVEVGANPDGTDRVIEEPIESSIVSYSFVREGERWLLSNATRARKFEGQIGCE